MKLQLEQASPLHDRASVSQDRYFRVDAFRQRSDPGEGPLQQYADLSFIDLASYRKSHPEIFRGANQPPANPELPEAPSPPGTATRVLKKSSAVP